MEIKGIDLSSLEGISLIPVVVPGKVLQLDGDCLCYECAGYDDDAFTTCCTNFKVALATRMQMAGCDHCNIHLTDGNKGGRYETAQVKEYQANRKGKPKPVNLAPLKRWLAETYITGKVITYRWTEQEADDGMAQFQYAAIQAGERHLSCIMSMDKDLCICSGLHVDWHSYHITDVDGFGWIELVTMSSKKVKGFGTAFFWAQLLMGDTADNIPGLPKIGMPMLDEVAPIKKPRDATATKPCGAVMAYNILKDCTTDYECLKLIVEAYKSYYGEGVFEYKTWRGNTIKTTSNNMVLEQAKLLWMRRVLDENPLYFMSQCVQGKVWTDIIGEVV